MCFSAMSYPNDAHDPFQPASTCLTCPRDSADHSRYREKRLLCACEKFLITVLAVSPRATILLRHRFWDSGISKPQLKDWINSRKSEIQNSEGQPTD